MCDLDPKRGKTGGFDGDQRRILLQHLNFFFRVRQLTLPPFLLRVSTPGLRLSTVGLTVVDAGTGRQRKLGVTAA